jgi:hypothetical protein
LTHDLLNKVINMSGIVCLLPEHICTSSDLLEQVFSLLTFAEFNTLLNDIVAISILHHLVKRSIHDLTTFLLFGCLHEFINDVFPILLATILQTLLNHVASKLMIAQFNDLTLYTLYDFVLVLLVLTMLQNVLDHIISELVFSQGLDFS